MQKQVIGNATLYQGDALDVLSLITEPVDALITDPPYSSGGFTRGDRMGATFDKYIGAKVNRDSANVDFSGDNRDVRSWAFWMTLVLSRCNRLVIPGGYVMTFSDWRQLPTLTDVYQASGFVWRGIVPWDKTESSRAPHTGYFRHQAEYVVWGSHGKLAKCQHGGPFPGVVRVRVKPSEKYHLTGKPIELMEQLIKPIPHGSTILDPFMGSGSTGIAALRAGHKFIGIELSNHYFDVACKRIEDDLARDKV